jgi:hypothetical protein
MAYSGSALIRLFLPIGVLVFFSSCSFEKPKTPVFTSNISSIENSIRKITDFKEITFDGSEITYKKGPSGVMEIKIIDLPMSFRFPTPHDEDSVLRNLGKKIVVDIQHHLKDSAEYRYYSLVLIRYLNLQGTKMTRYYAYDINDFEEKYPFVKAFN